MAESGRTWREIQEEKAQRNAMPRQLSKSEFVWMVCAIVFLLLSAAGMFVGLLYTL